MKGVKINTLLASPHILVAPLDWGLGHATRCIPLIHLLLNQGCRITIAASGPGITLLKKELPQVNIVSIPGYGINYSKTPGMFLPKLLLQFPRIASAIKRENRWLKNFIKENGIQAVISDNRMGMHCTGTPSAYITHQLQIETGYALLNGFARRLHYRYIRRFDECWVPDVKNEPSLAGKLSHPGIMPGIPVHYIGLLSRFDSLSKKPATNDILAIVSGPEPQRSIFEKLLRNQLAVLNISATLVQGLPGEPQQSTEGNLSIINHLDAAALQQKIAEAGTVICRSGYSSVMDFVAMQKPAIMVPTPGQGEQEYLGKYLAETGRFFCTPQAQFNLQEAMKAASIFYANQAMHFSPIKINETVITNWLQNLEQQ